MFIVNCKLNIVQLKITYFNYLNSNKCLTAFIFYAIIQKVSIVRPKRQTFFLPRFDIFLRRIRDKTMEQNTHVEEGSFY